MMEKINQQARKVAKALGAEGVVIIGFFREGEMLHMQDGGLSPMPLVELYKKMITVAEITEESGGEDVKIQ
jgi:hypothetical protein